MDILSNLNFEKDERSEFLGRLFSHVLALSRKRRHYFVIINTLDRVSLPYSDDYGL